MSKRIIISGRERILKPFIAFIMSFFISGMGEVYSGSPQKGIIIALLRVISLLSIPFYSITYSKSSYLNEIFFFLLFFILISILSPFIALLISSKNSKIVISKFTSTQFIIIFVFFNLIITLSSIGVFHSFFSIIKLNDNYPPVFEKGDIAVIKKIRNQPYKSGEMLFLQGRSVSFVRLIGLPGERVLYSEGRFSVQDSELFLSIFSENELKKFSLTDFDVISEFNDNIKYPVIQNNKKYKISINLKDNEYFAAPDDRNEISGFAIVKNSNIHGRVEGLLLSGNRLSVLIKHFLKSE